MDCPREPSVPAAAARRRGPEHAMAKTKTKTKTSSRAESRPARSTPERRAARRLPRGAAGGAKTPGARPRARKPAAAEPDGHTSAAGKSLVVVESPAKSRTLHKFLGRNFTVLASNGHVMDLPKSKLGVDLDNDFEPEYVPIRTKNNALAKIKAAAKDAVRIYLAPDPDREGEAIAWHLAESLKSARRPLQRLTFNEI